MFPEPRPGKLITGPVCGTCGGGTSQDDELFRLVLIAQQGVNDACVSAVWETTARGGSNAANRARCK